MTYRLSLRAFACLVLVLSCALPPVHGATGSPGPDKIRIFAAPVVSPPTAYDPGAGSATLTVRAAVRATDGLASQDQKAGGSKGRSYSVTASWSLLRDGVLVAQVNSAVPIQPPFSYVQLPPVSGGGGSREFVLAPEAIVTWDGRSSDGAVVEDGDYSWRADVCFVREVTNNRGVKEKLVDCAATSSGSIRVESGPPKLTVETPADHSYSTSLILTGIEPGILRKTEPPRAGRP